MDQYRRFDEAYYHRFYENPKTRIYGAKEHANLAQYVFSFARWNDIPVQSVLDIGAGIGLWKNWIAKNTKEVEYTGTEVSQVMCKKHGYQHRDIARWRDRRKYDLIICQGVLQYLSDPDVAPAVANIGPTAAPVNGGAHRAKAARKRASGPPWVMFALGHDSPFNVNDPSS